MQHFCKQVSVLSGKYLHRPFQAVPRRQNANQFELMLQGSAGEYPQFFGISQCLLESLSDFCRIENQREKLRELARLHPILEQAFDERPQCSRCVVDDVTQFLVFTMNVADHMHRPLGERQNSGQTSDFG